MFEAFKISDLVHHHVWTDHIYVITGFNCRDPKMPEWCNTSVRIEHLFSKNGSSISPSDKIRFVAPSIFEREFEVAENDNE